MPRRTLAAFDLKAARKMRGLSQQAAAEILCTAQSSVARWEAQGNMPEVFRKVWALHWQLEGKKHDGVHASATRVNVSNVSARTKELSNDKRSDRSTRKVRSRINKRKGGKQKLSARSERGEICAAEGTQLVPKSDSPATI